MKRFNVLNLQLLIISVLILSGCSGGSGETRNNRERTVPAVEAVRAQHGSLPLVERLSGVVEARNQVEIYPEMSGVISMVHAHNGDEVRRGTPLVRLRDREFQERLNQAKAAYQIALAQARQAEAKLKEINAELKRARTLAERDLSSEAQLETIETQALSAEADVELAQARVEQARANVAEQEEALSRTIIRAPISGTVGDRNAEIGMTVSAGRRLFTIGQLDNVRVEVMLTDRMLNYIETGQRVEIRLENVDVPPLTAALSRISPFLHPVAHSTEGEIDVANPDHILKPGMFTIVDIYYGESEQATLVPLSALYENPMTGATGVYVSSDSLDQIQINNPEIGGPGSLTEPVSFEFVPVDVIATGRMSAGVNGIAPKSWVITIGQDLLGGESGSARVRPVKWAWVEHLQTVQREDLLEEIIQKRQTADTDTPVSGT
ncbi:MAG: efflux RND transporter periplasmic adaptor subunit [candidate division Zixibacteria bacterium]|nr:efflux RND transporter periplasmic adaptor subunit [candidate division Zixibacteria bacterium]